MFIIQINDFQGDLTDALAKTQHIGAYPHNLNARFLHKVHLAFVRAVVARVNAALMRAMNRIGKHVEQHLRIACGAEHTVEERLGRIELLPEAVAVGEVTVVDQEDSEGRVHEERLRFFRRG